MLSTLLLILTKDMETAREFANNCTSMLYSHQDQQSLCLMQTGTTQQEKSGHLKRLLWSLTVNIASTNQTFLKQPRLKLLQRQIRPKTKGRTCDSDRNSKETSEARSEGAGYWQIFEAAEELLAKYEVSRIHTDILMQLGVLEGEMLAGHRQALRDRSPRLRSQRP